MWLASKFCNKCALLDISVSLSQRQLLWCGRTPVSLPKMSKYELEFFFPPVEKTGNTNKLLYCTQAAEQVCFSAPRLKICSKLSWKWTYVTMYNKHSKIYYQIKRIKMEGSEWFPEGWHAMLGNVQSQGFLRAAVSNIPSPLSVSKNARPAFIPKEHCAGHLSQAKSSKCVTAVNPYVRSSTNKMTHRE